MAKLQNAAIEKKKIIVIGSAHLRISPFSGILQNQKKFERFGMLTWLGRASFTRVPPRFSNGGTAS